MDSLYVRVPVRVQSPHTRFPAKPFLKIPIIPAEIVRMAPVIDFCPYLRVRPDPGHVVHGHRGHDHPKAVLYLTLVQEHGIGGFHGYQGSVAVWRAPGPFWGLPVGLHAASDLSAIFWSVLQGLTQLFPVLLRIELISIHDENPVVDTQSS